MSKGVKKMTKKEKFINTIKTQFNIVLENDKTNLLNKNRNILYTQINATNKNSLLSYLEKNNIRFEQHINNYFWVWLN